MILSYSKSDGIISVDATNRLWRVRDGRWHSCKTAGIAICAAMASPTCEQFEKTMKPKYKP